MAATIAVNTIFVFSLLASLTWEQRAMFLFATAALGGRPVIHHPDHDLHKKVTHLNKPN